MNQFSAYTNRWERQPALAPDSESRGSLARNSAERHAQGSADLQTNNYPDSCADAGTSSSTELPSAAPTMMPSCMQSAGRLEALPSVRRPMIVLDEVAYLARRYGTPQRLLYSVQADEYIHSYRWRKDADRRAEVVFAIQDPAGHVWLHTKPNYPSHVFRLPSGGVHLEEEIETALLREVYEETGLTVRIERFLGLLEYTFVYNGSTAAFASYVFHLYSAGGKPVACEGETICDFRPIPPSRLSEVAVDLRNLIGDRRGWGQWRALAHDLVHESLTNTSLSGKGNFAC